MIFFGCPQFRMLTEILWVVKSKLFPSIPIRVGHNRRRNEETFFFFSQKKIHSIIKNNFYKTPPTMTSSSATNQQYCWLGLALIIIKNNIAGLAATYDDQVVFARTRRV